MLRCSEKRRTGIQSLFDIFGNMISVWWPLTWHCYYLLIHACVTGSVKRQLNDLNWCLLIKPWSVVAVIGFIGKCCDLDPISVKVNVLFSAWKKYNVITGRSVQNCDFVSFADKCHRQNLPEVRKKGFFGKSNRICTRLHARIKQGLWTPFWKF